MITLVGTRTGFPGVMDLGCSYVDLLSGCSGAVHVDELSGRSMYLSPSYHPLSSTIRPTFTIYWSMEGEIFK